MRQIAARLLLSFAAYLAATRCLRADILTAQYDSFRTSWNASEIYLNVGNVNQARFGKLFSRQLDGWVYAQPLYMQSLTIPGHGAVNVVFVCTANNTVYAFDADSASVSAPYWSTNLGPADNTPNGPGSPNSEPLLGIISTPVIVPAMGRRFAVHGGPECDGRGNGNRWTGLSRWRLPFPCRGAYHSPGCLFLCVHDDVLVLYYGCVRTRINSYGDGLQVERWRVSQQRF